MRKREREREAIRILTFATMIPDNEGVCFGLFHSVTIRIVHNSCPQPEFATSCPAWVVCERNVTDHTNALFYRVKKASPVRRGFLPSLSLTILFLNSSKVQLSLSSPSKSPSRTTISAFAADWGPMETTCPVKGSTKATCRLLKSSPSIRVPVKTGREMPLRNCNCKLPDSEGQISFPQVLF